MDLAKAELFVNRICQKTENGEIDWKKTASESAYQATIGKFQVRIGYEEDDRGFNRITKTYFVSLYSISGELLDTYTEEDFDFSDGSRVSKDMGNRMNSAYEAARRKARGVEKALDDVLGELGEED